MDLSADLADDVVLADGVPQGKALDIAEASPVFGKDATVTIELLGNEGVSDPVEVTLPQRPFVKPMAKALVEQRRKLVLAPDDRGRVLSAIKALMADNKANIDNLVTGISTGVSATRDSIKQIKDLELVSRKIIPGSVYAKMKDHVIAKQ